MKNPIGQFSILLLLIFTNARLHSASRSQQITTPSVSLSQKITGSMLDYSSSTTLGLFTISEAGYYFLSTDLVVAPARSNLPIIYINASNVTLDLGSKSLAVSTTNHTPISTAIKIAPYEENITVLNGNINGAGTFATMDVGIDSQDNKSVNLENIQITNCALTGIKLTRDDNTSLNRIKTYNTGKIGLFMYQCNTGYIENSTFSGCTADEASTFGILACENQSFSMKNITITNITSTDGYAIGFYLGTSSSFVCNDINISNNSSLGSGPLCTGIYLSNSQGCTFESCTMNNNFAEHTASSCFGFFSTDESQNNTLEKCNAMNNKCNGAKTVGFYLDGTSNTRLHDCHSLSNYNKNTAAYGIFSDGGFHNFFKQCKANANYTGAGAAYGFALKDDERSIIEKCEASANDGGVDVGYGIALLGTCVQATVTNNKMFTNYGVDRCYGYKDFAAHTTTLLRGNVSFGHGRVFVGGRSHPLDSGNMNYMLTFGSDDDTLNAQFIIKESDWFDFRTFDSIVTDWFNFSIAE
jgi:hypothetical protein